MLRSLSEDQLGGQLVRVWQRTQPPTQRLVSSVAPVPIRVSCNISKHDACDLH